MNNKHELTSLVLAFGIALVGSSIGCGSQSPTPDASPKLPSSLSGGSTAPAVAGSIAQATPPLPAANSGNAGAPAVIAAGAPASAGAAGAAVPETPSAVVMPCSVSRLLAKNCSQCHGATPIAGAPMALVSHADFHKAANTKPTLKVYELARQRLNDAAKPMPPGGAITAADRSALEGWLAAGAPSGSTADATCDTSHSQPGQPSSESMAPLVEQPGEKCYEFKTHGSTRAVDDTRYDVKLGEHYANFYFKAPWPTGTVATRYGAKYDNLQVLHHWLFFSTAEDMPEGYHAESPLPTLAGTNATLLAGWAVGGVNLEMPPEVGFELPAQGSQINIQWHYYNSTGKPQSDGSAVQICTVPAGKRPHTASVTWIGTEDLGGNKWFAGPGMPPHQTSTFQGTCNPLREGMSATEPVHILGFWPHMHQLGTKMQAYVNRKNGTRELIFEKPFDFNKQVHYMQPYELQPGDTLTAVCHYNNTTDMGVPFGESSDTEMCYLFTFSYPAHALENHAPSLIGATNTCW